MSPSLLLWVLLAVAWSALALAWFNARRHESALPLASASDSVDSAEVESTPYDAARAAAAWGSLVQHAHHRDAMALDVVDVVTAHVPQVLAAELTVALFVGGRQHLREQLVLLPDDTTAERSALVLEQLQTWASTAVRQDEPVQVAHGRGVGAAMAVRLTRAATGRHPKPEVVGSVVVALPVHASLPEGAAVELAAALQPVGTALANEQEFRRVRRMSLTDPLTGAGNVRQLMRTLTREVERAHRFDRSLAVIMLDVDHFKSVNDQCGHAFGDVVLRELAATLHTCVREVDHVARYGGEEFVVVLPETGLSGAESVALRVQQRLLGTVFRLDGIQRQVTVSMGIAAYPQHGEHAAGVLEAADGALYQAKESGRDRWVVASEPEHKPIVVEPIPTVVSQRIAPRSS